MILTKLEVLNLDLPIWRYKFHKTALKLELFELASTQRSLTSGALGSDDPTGQRKKTGDGGVRWRGGGLARRRRGLRRHHGYLHDLREERNRLVLPARATT